MSTSYDAVIKVPEGQFPIVGHVVWGQIFGDKKLRFADGTNVHTSKVTGIVSDPKGLFVETMNSTYKVEFLPK